MYPTPVEHSIHPYGDFAALVLGIGALVFAFVQFRHSRHLISAATGIAEKSDQLTGKMERIVGDTKDIAEQSSQLMANVERIVGDIKDIAESVSTRFVGVFPQNMRPILNMIKEASSHVEIMADIAAYGHYSNPNAFLDYRYELERLAKNRHIGLRMIVYGEKRNDKSRRDQFKPVDFSSLQKDPSYKRFFEKKLENDRPKTYEDFLRVLAKAEQLCETQLADAGATICRSNEEFRLFLWLVDGKQAVFSFQMYGEQFHEICFWTRDRDLIDTFSELFEQQVCEPSSKPLRLA